MKRFSQLSRNTLIVAFSFGANKVLAILRQLIIARQFGLSSELDVFNVANNVPDMLYSLISGGALAMAIIPVLSEVITKKDRQILESFSQVATLHPSNCHPFCFCCPFCLAVGATQSGHCTRFFD